MKTLKVLIELHATLKCLSCDQLLVEFACKTKSFAIAILVIFFHLFFLLVAVFGWTGKNCLQIFLQFLLQAFVTNI